MLRIILKIKNHNHKAGMIVHTFNPGTQEASPAHKTRRGGICLQSDMRGQLYPLETTVTAVFKTIFS